MQLRRILDSDKMLADVSYLVRKRSNCLACVLEQRFAKPGIAPRFGDHLGADMRPDLGFIELDDAIERSAFDIALLDENRLEARTRSSISERLEPPL